MKRCSRCKEEKNLDEFSRDKSAKDGLQYMCKICQKEHYQMNKEKKKQYYLMNKEKRKEYVQMNKEEIKQYHKEYNKDYYHRNPEKQKARQKLNYAVKSGKVHKPLYCSSCDRDKHLEAHHTDYSKPLEVTWLCRTCHVELHNRLRDKELIIEEQKQS